MYEKSDASGGGDFYVFKKPKHSYVCCKLDKKIIQILYEKM